MLAGCRVRARVTMYVITGLNRLFFKKLSQNTTKHSQNTHKTPQNSAKHHKTYLLTKQTELAITNRFAPLIIS